MENAIVGASEARDRYERALFDFLLKLFLGTERGRPWVAVALAYHHGLSFGPSVGVLPEAERQGLEGKGYDTMSVFNPAEWRFYDDEPFELSEHLLQLGLELETLVEGGPLDEVPRYGREIHVRVTQALRQPLVDAGCLQPDGLIYATEFTQTDWVANVQAANPASALTAQKVTGPS